MRIKPVARFLSGSLLALSLASSAFAADATFWVRDHVMQRATELVDAFNATHENKIKLTSIPADQYLSKIGSAVAAGQAPDLMAIDLIAVPKLTAAMQLTDITAEVKALPYFEALSPSHIRLASLDNKIYGVPFAGEGSFLLWNKGLFKKAGLDPEKGPQSWAEIKQSAKAVRALGGDTYGIWVAGNCAGCNAFTFLPYIWANGGDVLTADGTKPTFNTKGVREAFAFYNDLWKSGLMPPNAKSSDQFVEGFANGKTGMAMLGAFSIELIKSKYPDIDFGVTPIPGQTAGSWSSFAGGDTLAIPKGSARKAEAMAFVAWLTSKETQLAHYAKSGAVPVRTDLADNEYSAKEPRLIVATKAMAGGRTPYVVPYMEIFNSANGPFLRAVQKGVFEGKIDEALKEADSRITRILADE